VRSTSQSHVSTSRRDHVIGFHVSRDDVVMAWAILLLLLLPLLTALILASLRRIARSTIRICLILAPSMAFPTVMTYSTMSPSARYTTLSR
jgi:hypothetical protein